MKYLITGAGGMLGHDLLDALRGRDAVGLTRAQLDIADPDAVRDTVDGFDVVINAAAYTKVDDAETHEDAAFAVNATGPGNLASACAATGATLVHVSTDYVFDGTATEPYPEDAPLYPVSAYGRTKAEGERLVRRLHPDGSHIIRAAWLYGQHGGNFATTMLRLAAERDTVEVVTDQVGQPTWTADLARQIVTLLDSGVASGTWHGTNAGRASWYDFARSVFSLGGHDPDRVKPTVSAKFVRPAPRPAFSVLGHDAWAAAGLEPMRPWPDALRDAFATGALRPPETHGAS